MKLHELKKNEGATFARKSWGDLRCLKILNNYFLKRIKI